MMQPIAINPSNFFASLDIVTGISNAPGTSISFTFFMPNSFTPNGDNLNDTFGAEAVETYQYHLKIINRFGTVVFESHDLNKRWSGNNAPQGTYVYHLDYRQVTKELGVLQNFRKVGTVTLIR